MPQILSNARPLILSIDHLKRAGLLNGTGSSKWIDIGASAFIRTCPDNHLAMYIPKLPSDMVKEFPVEDARIWSHHDIRFELVKIKFGFRPYFICPLTDQRCLKLVFYRGAVTSITAFNLIRTDVQLSNRAVRYEVRRARLLKLDGKQRASGKDRDILLKELGMHQRRLREDEHVLNYQDQFEHQRKRDEKKFLWESRPLSMTKGLDVGQGAYQHLAYDEYVSKPDGWAESLPLVEPASPRPLPASIESYPELNINILIERKFFATDQVAGTRLGWPTDRTENYRIYLFVDGRRDGLPLFVARIEDEESNVRWQNILLLSSSRSEKPRYMLCPLSHIRCQLMYFRNGFFASREAHGLYNPSQRAAGRPLNHK